MREPYRPRRPRDRVLGLVRGFSGSHQPSLFQVLSARRLLPGHSLCEWVVDEFEYRRSSIEPSDALTNRVGHFRAHKCRIECSCRDWPVVCAGLAARRQWRHRQNAQDGQKFLAHVRSTMGGG
ncbi:MAG: hypothetical protein ACREBE_10250 [bacterium]